MAANGTATQVRVVAADRAGALARRVEADLARAGHRVAFCEDQLPGADGVHILLDDDSLPNALARLMYLLPGRATFPHVILVVDEPDKAGGLLGEGFRDVVSAADAGRAVDALVHGRPPVLMARLREEIHGDFLPKFVAEMRQRAKEKQNLLRECIELVRASEVLWRRIFKLRRMLDRQSIDELLVQDGMAGRYLDLVDEEKRPRLTRLPHFPVGQTGGVLSKREPRYRKAREEVEDALTWLRQDGLLAALDKSGHDALNETATELKNKPLQGLRECLNIIEREIALRLSLIDRIQTDVNAIAVLEERCLERHGFAILPPGIAVPENVHLLLRSLAQPPAEIYVTWCLDLRDLRLKPCADVLDDIARDLAWSREPAKRPLPELAAGALDRLDKAKLTETGDRK